MAHSLFDVLGPFHKQAAPIPVPSIQMTNCLSNQWHVRDIQDAYLYIYKLGRVGIANIRETALATYPVHIIIIFHDQESKTT